MKRVKTLTGKALRDATHKTVVVEIRPRKAHPLYQKVVWQRKKILVHDEQNEVKAGDRVVVVPCRPLSRSKRHRLVKVVGK